MTQAIFTQPTTARHCTLRIAWDLSPGAAKFEDLRPDAPARLELSLELSRAESHSRAGPLSARITQERVSRKLDLPRTHGHCITDPETGLTHIDIPGLLHLSLRSESPARPLYARTTLLQRLGIPGGRYEFAGASLTP